MNVRSIRTLALVCSVFVATVIATYVTLNGTKVIGELAAEAQRKFSGAYAGFEHETGQASNYNVFSRLPGLRKPSADSAADSSLTDEALVIGVSIGEKHRAYACSALANPLGHVINDLVAGVPVTVAYSDPAKVARVLTQHNRSEPLDVGYCGVFEFGNCGVTEGRMQIEIDGVDFDLLDGDLPLADLSFVQTTWGEWKGAHPDCDVVSSVPIFPDLYLHFAGVRTPAVHAANSVALSDRTSVIGVTVESGVRAYLVQALRLPATHVINDLIGNVAVTVTYCDRTDCARVMTELDRREPLDVAVAGFVRGKLLLDIEGRTYSQDDGDVPLPDLEFSRTTWGEWKAQHPDTEVYMGTFSDVANMMSAD
jgi:hypothetical protein